MSGPGGAGEMDLELGNPQREPPRSQPPREEASRPAQLPAERQPDDLSHAQGH